MSKHYFQFKQWRIEQEHCAMKVSTDACIQGAWTPVADTVKSILDIGTGTGLLSLMLAQRAASATIDAIEIDTQVAEQAAQNVSSSIFSKQVKVAHADARNWQSDRQYDLIVCNPPFFTGSLRGPDAARNRARHDDDLGRKDLASSIAFHLAENGCASILLPFTERSSWEIAAKENNLFTSKYLLVKPFEHAAANRIVLICSKQETPAIEEQTLVIYKEPKVYTEAFTTLMRPFYLNL